MHVLRNFRVFLGLAWTTLASDAPAWRASIASTTAHDVLSFTEMNRTRPDARISLMIGADWQRTLPASRSSLINHPDERAVRRPALTGTLWCSEAHLCTFSGRAEKNAATDENGPEIEKLRAQSDEDWLRKDADHCSVGLLHASVASFQPNIGGSNISYSTTSPSSLL